MIYPYKSKTSIYCRSYKNTIIQEGKGPGFTGSDWTCTSTFQQVSDMEAFVDLKVAGGDLLEVLVGICDFLERLATKPSSSFPPQWDSMKQWAIRGSMVGQSWLVYMDSR